MTSLLRTCGTPGRRIGLRLFAAAAMVAIGLGVASVPPAIAADDGPTVTIGSTTPDAGAGSVTLGDVKIAFPGAAGTKLAIRKIVLKGVDPGAETFKAGQIDIEGLTTDYSMGAKLSLTLDQATLKAVAAPPPSSDRFGAAGKAGELPPLAAWLLAAKVDSIAAPTMVLRTEVDGIVSTITYKDLAITGIDAGKIASLVIGGAAQDSTGTQAGQAAKVTMGRIALDAVDFTTYAAWFDDKLAAAAPKEKRLAYKSFTVDGIAAVSDQGTFSLDKLSGADIKLGPPAMKPSELVALMDKIRADPDFGKNSPREMTEFLRTVFAAFEIGTFEATGIKFSALGKSPGSIGLMRLENFAGTRIGEMRFGDLAFTDETDGTAIKLGSFAIRGFDIVGLDAMLDKIAQGGGPDTMPIDDYAKPRITGIALADLDAVLPGKGKFTIGGITLDTPDWVGFSPITVKGRVEGFSLPVDAIEDVTAREQFKALGLDTLTVNSAVDLAWKESEESLAVGPIALDIDGVGKAVVGGGFGGVPKSLFEHPETAEELIGTLDFRSLTLSLENGGAFPKIVDMVAQQQGTTRAKLAQQTAQQVQGGMIMFLGMDQAAAKLGAALKAFIADPKSLKVAIAALEPIPAVAFMKVSQGDQDALGLIKKSITIDASANQ